MKNTLLIATIILFSISKIYAQSPANEQKKDTASIDRTPRKNTDVPPVKENNKPGQPSTTDQQKTNPPAVTDRTPRTFNDQPPIKEVPKNYPAANRKSNRHRHNHRSDSSRSVKKSQ